MAYNSTVLYNIIYGKENDKCRKYRLGGKDKRDDKEKYGKYHREVDILRYSLTNKYKQE